MSNVDHAEIAKFEALAHRWWDRESEFKPLHDINPLRVNWIDERAGLAGKKVLDIGCGGGILSEAMAQRGASVTGIDMGEAPLAVARLHQLESGVAVDYRQITAEQMAVHTDYATDPVAISPDGERFYFVEARRSAAAPPHLRVVLNWAAEVERLLAQ